MDEPTICDTCHRHRTTTYTAPVSLRMDPADLEAINAGAKARGVDRSTWIRRILAAQVAADRERGRI